MEESQGTRFDIKLTGNLSVNENDFSQFFVDYFNLTREYSLQEIRRDSDDEDNTHIRLNLQLNRQRILGSDLIAHYNKGRLYRVNGVLHKPSLGQTASLDESTARDLAIQFSGGSHFKWESADEERMIKIWKEDENATYFPKGELVYVPRNIDFGLEYALCYGFEINADEPLMRKNIYVNVQTQELWAVENLLHDVEVTGSANTKYRGVKSIQTDSTAPGVYRLREYARGGGIETYNMQTGTNYGAAVDFTDTDNYWNNYNVAYDEIAADAHYGAEKTYDYFLNNFGRNSFNGSGAKIRSYVHYRSNYVNAFWNGSVMTYGDGNGGSWLPLTTVDVCGHEIAHAVTTYSAGLVYSYQSGALNESFSDIFGNSIEYFADPTLLNWRMGEDLTTSGNGIRNMANPNSFGDPDTYLGTYWHTAASDNGGVHTNSGVQNFWYYILCTGRVGTNDNADTYNVDSIGILKAQQIAYRNLTVYLTSSSNYADARYYGIESAKDLYGVCSGEMIATTNAWYAVGVGDEYDSSQIVVDYLADTAYCTSPQTVAFENRSSNANGYLWYFGDGTTSTLENPTHTYNNQGDYTVKLVADGCFFGLQDSLEIVDYIEIDSTRDICNADLPIQGAWTMYSGCQGFIYDHGGESDYSNLQEDTVTINFGTSDSAHLTFQDFDYEQDYDSIYVYDGNSVAGTLVGGYTGTTLPNGGNPISIFSGAVTVRHFSDQLLVGRGFKAEYEAFRPALGLTLTPDTLVCYNQNITLTATGTGGSSADYSYRWNGTLGGTTFTISTTQDTTIYILFSDECMEESIYDSVVITVLNPISIVQLQDSTLCYLEDITLTGSATGGRVVDYAYEWLPTNVTSNPWMTEFTQDSIIRLVVSDGCTPLNDTMTFNIFVRDSLSESKSSDIVICEGSSTTLTLNPSGGLNSYDYTFWDASTSGTSSSTSKVVSPVGSGIHDYWIAYTDNCTDTKDTAFYAITVRDSLSVTTSPDVTICVGESVNLVATANGGLASAYSYDWGAGASVVNTLNVSPITTTKYYINLSDGCSSFEPIDSVLITVREPLDLVALPDTTLCYLEDITLLASPSGGVASNYTYQWLPFGITTATWDSSFTTDTTISLVLSDGCTVKNDTVSFKINVRDPLTKIQSPDVTLCEGESTTLTLTPSGGLGTYSYDYSDGTSSGTATTASMTVSPIGSGTHDFWIRYTDNCTETEDTAFYEIIIRDSLSVSLSSDITICYGESTTLTATAGGGVSSSYMYDWGSGASASSTRLVSPTTTTKYYVELSDGCSNFLPIDSVLVTVRDQLLVSITAQDTACYGEDVTLTANVTGGDVTGYTYNWNTGSGTSSTFMATMVTDQSFGVIVSDGCTPTNATANHDMKVRDQLALVMPADVPICNGESIVLTPTPSGGVPSSYVLTWANGLGTGLTKNVAPENTTTYTITLSDNCGTDAVGSVTVTVNPLPNVDFSAGPSPSCEGQDIDFTNETITGAGSTFNWSFGEGSTSTNEDATFAYNNAGFYTIKLVVVNEFGCEDSLIKTNEIEIIPNPVARFTNTPVVADLFNPIFTFTNTSTDAIDHVWTFGEGGTSSLNNPIYTYSDTGSYQVTLTVSNVLGCTDQVTKIVRVEDVFLLHIPNAFTPNDDKTNDTYGVVARGIRSYDILIVNRWGEIVYRSDDFSESWDGNYQGKKAIVGLYYYIINGVNFDGESFKRDGSIYLLE